MKSVQELWVGRLMVGTWTPEYLVPEMKAAAEYAEKSIKAWKESQVIPFRHGA
jgi:hypothetical protein